MKNSLIIFLLFFHLPLLSENYHSTFKLKNKCYGNLHKEKYIKGDASKPGFVRKWQETINIPCKDHENFNSSLVKEENIYIENFKNLYNHSFNWLKMKISEIHLKYYSREN